MNFSPVPKRQLLGLAIGFLAYALPLHSSVEVAEIGNDSPGLRGLDCDDRHPSASILTNDLPKFEAQEIDSDLKIGYGVIIEDIDGDGRPDIVVVDQHQVVWYRNPGSRGEKWHKYVILDGQTRKDNVCIAAIDIDGDGLPELVVGAGWQPFNTQIAGQLVWLRRGDDVTHPWTMYELPCDEPSVHRVRAIDIDDDGKREIVHVPLMGRDATREGNWMDGQPLAVVALKVPDTEPEKKENWKSVVLSQKLHVAHGFSEGHEGGFARPGRSILVGSYDGISLIYPEGTESQWTTLLMHSAHQENPSGNRGASEIKVSNDGRGVIATIEPWHGNQVVVYTPGKPDPEKAFSLNRHVIDRQLLWGHAVWFADLDGDGVDELIVGVRDDPNPDQAGNFVERRGVRLYKSLDAAGEKWQRTILENGGVAVEDLAAADLDNDGNIDIVAVGRQTGNARIYWNLNAADDKP